MSTHLLPFKRISVLSLVHSMYKTCLSQNESIMLTTRISLIVIPLSYNFLAITAEHTVTQSPIKCIHDEPVWVVPGQFTRARVSSDCRRAIAIIPTAYHTWDDGNIFKPLSYFLPPNARNRCYKIPALLTTGSCGIAVEPIPSETQKIRSPSAQAGLTMYLNVWPEVKKTAEMIHKYRVCQHRNVFRKGANLPLFVGFCSVLIGHLYFEGAGSTN